MKKLTAGIFASILGLTAIGAADAAVPSTKYVDDAVAAAQLDVADTYATKDALTAETNARTQADSTLQGNIDTLAGTVAGKADTADLKQVAFTADYNDLLNVPAGQAPLTDTQLQAVNSGITVDKVVAYDAVAADYVTEQELTDSQAAQNTNITAAANAASAADTKAGNAQAAADNAAAAASTADGKAVAAQTAAENAAAAAAAADTKAGNAQTTANEAKDAAAAADTKAGNAQTAANEAKDAAAANATAIEGKLSADAAAATYELKANVSGAQDNAENGKYVLTKIVTQGEGGVEVVSYGWELIDREYSAQ